MRFRISHRITVVFGIVFFLILIGVFVYLNSSLKEHTYKNIKLNLERETSLAKSLIENCFLQGTGLDKADVIADRIGKDLGLRTTIIAHDGTVLGDSELNEQQLAEVENHLYRDEVQQALKSGMGTSRRYSTTIRLDMLYVARVLDSGRKGIIRLAIPLSEIDYLTKKLTNLLIITVLIAFIATVGISYIASVLISRPVRKMSLAARSILEGDYSKAIMTSSNDEIGDLALAFNEMIMQIQNDINEITSGKSRLEAVLLSMSEGVMAVDSKGSITLINKALKDFLIIGEDPIGRKPIEVLRNADVQNVVDEVLASGTGVKSAEITVLLPEERHLLVHATPITSENVTEGTVLVFYDITELKRLEQVRRDFVANVSHELRTPVASIKGYAETLLEGALDDKDNAQGFLRIIHSESERLAALITDLLSLSRIESGKLKMTLKPTSLDPIISRALSGLEYEARRKTISISIDIPDDAPKILADEEMLTQVLLNLIDNSIKYTPENGKITVSAEEHDDYIKVMVADTGMGIPEKDIPRIFERFYRVDRARSRQLGGTGLGLSIVKHIVQVHRGEVTVESQVDKGTIISFTIPKAC